MPEAPNPVCAASVRLQRAPTAARGPWIFLKPNPNRKTYNRAKLEAVCEKFSPRTRLRYQFGTGGRGSVSRRRVQSAPLRALQESAAHPTQPTPAAQAGRRVGPPEPGQAGGRTAPPAVLPPQARGWTQRAGRGVLGAVRPANSPGKS